MRLFSLVAAVIFAALVTPPATAQETTEYRTVLRLTITTGDDDLRGGRDSVRGSYRIGDTWSTATVLNRRGMRWADRSRNVAEISVPVETARGLNAVRLQTSFGGGIDGDNWNMQQLQAQLCFTPASAGMSCIDLARHGPKRFTGSDGTLIVPLVWPSNPGLINK